MSFEETTLFLLVFSAITIGIDTESLPVALHTHNCSYYDDECEQNTSGEHHDCAEHPMVCPGSKPYCYILFRLVGPNRTEIITKKDCWDGHDPDCFHPLCRYFLHENSNFYYCCCQGNMCNLEIGPQITSPPPPSSPSAKPTHRSDLPSGGSDPGPGTSNKKRVVIAIAGTVSVVVFVAAVVVFSFWCWSRRRPLVDEALENDGDRMVMELDALDLSRSDSPESVVDLDALELITKIGSGRFSEVWKASLDEDFVAVKIFQEKNKQSWVAERSIYTNPEIKHENLRGFIAARRRDDTDSSPYWMLFDFYELGSLNEYLKANVLTLQELCRMAASVASGLAYLHSEIPSSSGLRQKLAIAHRDLKSRNVLVKKDCSCCICDLGLSIKFQPGTSLTEAQGQVGTVRYMAPEVLEGAITFNRESFLRIDVYALGLVIWELMSRCNAKGAVCEYKQPFEEEVGLHPSIEQMKDAVVTSRIRPKFMKGWHCIQPLDTLVETVVECWDHDAEARLTAQCVEERVNRCRRYDDEKRESSHEVLESTGNTVELPRHQYGPSSGHQSHPHPHSHPEVGTEQTNVESNGHPPMVCNGRPASLHSQGISRSVNPSGVNGIKPLRPPYYPPDRSASPPPYSAVPLPPVYSEKNGFPVVPFAVKTTQPNYNSSAYTETSL